MRPLLDGARVLVLGGSGALGSRIARQMAGRGARVMLAGRDAVRLRHAADAIGPDVPTTEFDLRKPETFGAVVDTAIASLGGLDGVVNAAGVVGFGALVDTSDATIDELVAVDLVGPIKFMKAVLRRLDGGFWVNITGSVVEQPMPGLATYSAVKAGLSAASQAMARELRRSGMAVIDVRPPHTETGLSGRPIAGTAPVLATGLVPDIVASRIVSAIEAGERVVDAKAFVAQ